MDSGDRITPLGIGMETKECRIKEEYRCIMELRQMFFKLCVYLFHYQYW